MLAGSIGNKISQINIRNFKIYNVFIIKSAALNITGIISIEEFRNKHIYISSNFGGIILLKYK